MYLLVLPYQSYTGQDVYVDATALAHLLLCIIIFYPATVEAMLSKGLTSSK